MKTYQQNIKGEIYQYFYDRNIKLWTIYKVDQKGYILNEPEYYNDKKQLKTQYKELKFKEL